MEERQINKWLRRQYSPLGWSLLGYYGILNVLVLASTMALTGQQWLMAMRTGNWERWMDPSLAAGEWLGLSVEHRRGRTGAVCLEGQ